ncbi:MAG TPA: hypothetical protein VIY48_07070 [Candidatus Paceibacterota bacterium]
MVGKVAPKTTIAANESEIKLRFGGGLNTRASSDEIDEREASAGYNFDLDLGNTQFRPRKPFDLSGTAPNAGQINGFAQLVKVDGTISTIIQAGSNVYKLTDWSTWSLVGTVSSSARLRGHRQHIWNLDEVVLIADVAGVEEVAQWDGTTFTQVYHNLVGPFIAKYIYVDNERAYYANVTSNGTATPHVLVGSAQSDYTTLDTSNKPSDALAASDAFYLPMPDLKAINGLTGAFGVLAMSTKRGQIYSLTGTDATDFSINALYYDSYADGTESMVFAGNDVVYGRPGRIESLSANADFGDVETNDLSVKISDQISSFTGWTMVYSSRHQRVYCHPSTESQLWVFHKPLASAGLSPWMQWTTNHTMGFNPTTMWSMLDPETGLEHAYCGDSSGNVYKLEGTGTLGDGGTTDITATRTSKLYSAPGLSQLFDLQGAVKYRPVTGETSSFNLTMQWQGESVFDKSIDMTLAAAESGAVFGGSDYFGDGSVFGNHFEGRLARQRFTVPGQANEVQFVCTGVGTTTFQINEIYCGFRAAG